MLCLLLRQGINLRLEDTLKFSLSEVPWLKVTRIAERHFDNMQFA